MTARSPYATTPTELCRTGIRIFAGETVRSVVDAALKSSAVPSRSGEHVLPRRSARRFPGLDAEATALSGGWQKRLAIVQALVKGPDILLLDETHESSRPGGHRVARRSAGAGRLRCVVISHDRYFLENVATEMAELSRIYPDGLLR